MEPLEAIDRLAELARRETTPTTNIAVARLLRATRAHEPLRLGPMIWSAAISAVAAVLVLGFALHQSQSTSVDPISPLFSAAQVQMP